ncbi:MAG: amino acid-binding protein [Gammaproteobacteria bacterium]|nr:amino acid-binding protein [Gammaproteobacteria bacterium]
MNWSVLTLVGADQKGIVAAVSKVLFEADCQLAEASMMRLGGNFAMMLRVGHVAEMNLAEILQPVVTAMQLHLHVDDDVPAKPQQLEPDVHITVYGADRTGIVAQVTSLLADAGLHIVDLETAVGGSSERPVYIMSLEGSAGQGVEALRSAIQQMSDDIEISLTEINTLRA